jgi:hypothetical protein
MIERKRFNTLKHKENWYPCNKAFIVSNGEKKALYFVPTKDLGAYKTPHECL